MPYMMNRLPKVEAGGLTVGQKLENITPPGEDKPYAWEGYGEVVDVDGEHVVVVWHHDGTRERIEGEEVANFAVKAFDADYWVAKLGKCVDG